MKRGFFCALALGAGILSGAATAQDMAMQPGQKMGPNGGHHMHGHGPIGVMSRHLLPEGKFMLALRSGHMQADGSRIGTTDVSPAFVATTVPNRFFGLPGQPPTIRVVPLGMRMDMAMLGGMYGLNDRVTLSAMVPYIRKDMSSVTFAGPVGPAVLGVNKMSSEGLGDVRVGALVGLMKEGRHSLNFGLGLSLPTGSITETGRMLNPLGLRPIRRMGYGMQLGSGTFDLLPALTYQGGRGRLNWGAQLAGTIRLGSNDEGYSLGDEARLNLWASYKPAKWISYSGRIEASTLGTIDGLDRNIMMPNSGSDPLNYGGERVTAFLGADLTVQRGALKGHKFGMEVGVPVYQDLNGPQLKRDWSLAFAWRKSF